MPVLSEVQGHVGEQRRILTVGVAEFAGIGGATPPRLPPSRLVGRAKTCRSGLALTTGAVLVQPSRQGKP